MKTASSALLTNVLAVGLGREPFRCDLRLNLYERRVRTVAEPQTLTPDPEEIHYTTPEMWLTPGWVDMRATVGQPGYEHRETLDSLRKAAAAGGFTKVAVLPETHPPIADRASVQWLRTPVPGRPELLPTAALTTHPTGEDLTEILDLHEAGAVAFTNGTRCLHQTALVIKALRYLQTCNGLLVQFPQEPHLTAQAQLHEGVISTQLGMSGFPAVGESLIVERDLRLLEYLGGRLHFSGVSTKESIAAIRSAKAQGLAVSCDVAAYQSSLSDSDVTDFDTHKKVIPPFRTAEHQEAIQEGLLDGTIDVIASHHLPWHEEAKKLEFDRADFGIISLQTAAATAWESWGKTLGKQNFVKKWTENPRRLLGLKPPELKEGAPLDFTLFAPKIAWEFTPSENHSKSANTPFFGRRFHGKPLAAFM